MDKDIVEEYVREDGGNYWRVWQADGCCDSDGMRMVMRNRIQGLLEVRECTIDNREVYYYDMGHMKPLDAVCRNTGLQYGAVVGILVSLDRVRKRLDEYLLDREAVLLSPGHIFVDGELDTVCFVYAPFMKRDYDVAMKRLFEYMMEHMDYGDKRNNVRFYEAYQQVVRGEAGLSGLIETLGRSTAEEEVKPVELEIPSVMPESVDEEAEVQLKLPGLLVMGVKAVLALALVLVLCSQAFSGSFFIRLSLAQAAVCLGVLAAAYFIVSAIGRMSFMHGTRLVRKTKSITYRYYDSGDEKTAIVSGKRGEAPPADLGHGVEQDRAEAENPTMLLDAMAREENPTMLLATMAREVCVLRLEPVDSGTAFGKNAQPANGGDRMASVAVRELPCVVGSGRSADVVLDLPYVSRTHFSLDDEDGLGVTDLFSSNGTCVNGSQLSPGKRVRLADGDVITVAGYGFKVVTGL